MIRSIPPTSNTTLSVKPRPKVLVVEYGGSDGGSVYESMVAESLAGHFDVSRYALKEHQEPPSGHLAAPFRLGKLWLTLHSSSRYALTVKTFDVSFLKSRPVSRNVVIVHHLHERRLAGSSLRYEVHARIQARILRNLAGSNATLVVVSEYWKQRLREKGFRNVSKIYNAFRNEEFVFRQEEIEAFKRKYGLADKPIIYLGNYKPLGGANCAFEALRDLDAHLIASSSAATPAQAPVRSVALGRQEYLKLLKASTLAVNMSQFAEGWCRNAHEAMLCGTPVVGSGQGGMRELLEAGRQIICDDFRSLRASVEGLLSNADTKVQLGQAGYRYASQFTYEKFQSQWRELASRLCQAA